MNWLGKFHLGSCAAAALLIAALAFPPAGRGQELDEGDLMNMMKEAYSGVVKALLMFPVEESSDTAPFPVVVKGLEKITEIARLLPKLENYKNDKDFIGFAKNLEKESIRIAGIAKKGDQKASVSSLADLQAACLKCHSERRF